MKRVLDCNNSSNKKEKMLRTVDNYINYISVPTLKSIATVRVVTALNVPLDVRNSTIPRKYNDVMSIGQENFHIDAVRNKKFDGIDKIVSILPLHSVLKAPTAFIARLIELERIKWMQFFDCTECVEFLHTNEGTIDRQKIVEAHIVKNSRHCMSKIFELACNCCFETYIPQIWGLLPEAEKNRYLSFQNISFSYDLHLVYYWIPFALGVSPELFFNSIMQDYGHIYNANQSVYWNMFTLGLSEGNVRSAKYFWGKLTDGEKSSNLTRWIKDVLEKVQSGLSKIIRLSCDEDDRSISDLFLQVGASLTTSGYPDLLYFLLSQMTDDQQQREVFQENSLLILGSLLVYWPLRKFLLPTLQVMWDYLDEKVYIDFISLVVNEIKEGYDTEDILRKVWCSSPPSFRKCFINDILSSGRTDVLCNLLLVKDTNTIQLILRDVEDDERRSLIFSLITNRKLLQLIYRDKLGLFDILIRNTLTSNDILDLKKMVARVHGRNLCHQWICDDNFESLEKFISWAFTSQNQIDFKHEIIDKTEIVLALVRYPSNFELADKFLNWCYSTQEDVNEFKKNFAFSNCKIVGIGQADWDMLEKLVRWCFVSDNDVNEFKIRVLQNDEIVGTPLVCGADFEFANKLINWCCHSEEDIKEYKARFVMSDEYMVILQEFLLDCFDDGDDLCEELINSITLFSPLEERTIVMLKDKIKNSHICPSFAEEHVFRMIDLVNNICD